MHRDNENREQGMDEFKHWAYFLSFLETKGSVYITPREIHMLALFFSTRPDFIGSVT